MATPRERLYTDLTPYVDVLSDLLTELDTLQDAGSGGTAAYIIHLEAVRCGVAELVKILRDSQEGVSHV